MRIVAFVASPLVNDEKEVYSIRLLEIEQSNSKPSTQDRTSIVFLQLDCTTVAKPADIWSCKCKFFCVYKLYKESISKEMNNVMIKFA